MGLIQVRRGDIATATTDAIVTSVDEDLFVSGGVNAAIHAAAGPSLSAECAGVGHCAVGEALSTDAGSLAARRVIHTVVPARFGKTRIAVNLGLAAGATKRYIVDPEQEGGFAKGAPKRKRTIAKAVVAGAFAAKQLNDAKKLAERDPDLQPLIAKITGLTGVLGGLTAALQGGNVDVADLVGAGSEVDQLLDAGRTLGLDVTERTPPGL